MRRSEQKGSKRLKIQKNYFKILFAEEFLIRNLLNCVRLPIIVKLLFHIYIK